MPSDDLLAQSVSLIGQSGRINRTRRSHPAVHAQRGARYPSLRAIWSMNYVPCDSLAFRIGGFDGTVHFRCVTGIMWKCSSTTYCYDHAEIMRINPIN